MSLKKDICVIGVGRFGNAVIEQLVNFKKQVLAIDINEASLFKVSPTVKTFIADAANLETLKSLGVNNFNTVIVAASENIEIIAALIEIGVDKIIAKAKTKRHERVLRAIGVDVIIIPEAEAGWRAALIASNKNFIKYSENLQNIGDNYAIGGTIITNKHWINKPLKKINFEKFGISVVAAKRENKVYIPHGDFEMKEGDLVTLIGKVEAVNDMFSSLNSNTQIIESEIKTAKKKIMEN